MTEMRVGDQTIRYDRDATAAVYASLGQGSAEDGCHLYGGWFYFVGEMVTAGERNSNAPDSHYFESFFTTAHPSDERFAVGLCWRSNSRLMSSGC
jgi:hypothetical protein